MASTTPITAEAKSCIHREAGARPLSVHNEMRLKAAVRRLQEEESNNGLGEAEDPSSKQLSTKLIRAQNRWGVPGVLWIVLTSPKELVSSFVRACASGRPRQRIALLTCCMLLGVGALAVVQLTRASKPKETWEQQVAGQCIGWRSTDWCDPHGRRVPAWDKPCEERAPELAGYCECRDGRITALVGCGLHRFTCADKCAELKAEPTLGKPFPKLMQCSAYPEAAGVVGAATLGQGGSVGWGAAATAVIGGDGEGGSSGSGSVGATAGASGSTDAAAAGRSAASKLNGRRAGPEDQDFESAEIRTLSKQWDPGSRVIVPAVLSQEELEDDSRLYDTTAFKEELEAVAAAKARASASHHQSGTTSTSGTAQTASPAATAGKGYRTKAGKGARTRAASQAAGTGAGAATTVSASSAGAWSGAVMGAGAQRGVSSTQEQQPRGLLAQEQQQLQQGQGEQHQQGLSKAAVDQGTTHLQTGGQQQHQHHQAHLAAAGAGPHLHHTGINTAADADQGSDMDVAAAASLDMPVGTAMGTGAGHRGSDAVPHADNAVTVEGEDQGSARGQRTRHQPGPEPQHVQGGRGDGAADDDEEDEDAPVDVSPFIHRVNQHEHEVKRLWDSVSSLVRKHAYSEGLAAQLPGVRTEHSDWVLDGVRLPSNMVEELRVKLRSFKASLPAYPQELFSGRGVVMIAGGLKYMVSAWIGLHMLRRSGCTLPVEVWFPISEMPTPDLEKQLHSMGAFIRTFDQRDLDQSGFTLKPSALLLSSFQEVLFLDADNFAVQDPSVLFETPEFEATGALLWQDFWEPSAAPQVFNILEIPSHARPSVSHESGQMVLDKARHWKGLLLCMYLNYYHEVYYELLNSFMGKGDKETFPHAMLAMGEQVHTVAAPTQAVGMWRQSCHVDSAMHPTCETLLAANTMAQRDPAGGYVVFLHSNLNKWTLDLPDKFTEYARRWMLLARHGGKPPVDFQAWSHVVLGYDVEQYAYNLVRSMRCAPWFPEYYRMRLRRGDAPMTPFNGPHELVGGMYLIEWYRWGLRGAYSNMLQPTLKDHWENLLHGTLGIGWRQAVKQGQWLMFWRKAPK